MVTPVPPPLIDAPRFPVCDPLDQPVKVLSSNPASGMETEVASAYDDGIKIDTRDITSAGTIAQEPLLKDIFLITPLMNCLYSFP
jgi:hypothetical protein